MQEDSSSAELDVPAAELHSSTEDLLEDSALQGTPYYRDLGLPSPAMAQAAPAPAAQPDRAARPSEERPGPLSNLSLDVAFSNPVSCSVRYGEADCSRAAVLDGGTSTWECPAEAGKELELQEAEESFPTLVRSMSTSRRHSWESPLSPVDCKRRYGGAVSGTRRTRCHDAAEAGASTLPRAPAAAGWSPSLVSICQSSWTLTARVGWDAEEERLGQQEV